MATALATGAGMGAGVAALTAACPPAGLAVGGVLVLAAKPIWTAGQNAWNLSTGKTQTERKLAAKKAMIQAVNLGL